MRIIFELLISTTLIVLIPFKAEADIYNTLISSVFVLELLLIRCCCNCGPEEFSPKEHFRKQSLFHWRGKASHLCYLHRQYCSISFSHFVKNGSLGCVT